MNTNPYLLAGEAGLGLVRSLFGGRHKFHDPYIAPFSFTPDPNDPEIGLRRRNALLDIQRGHSDTINEIGRAGLLGSSAAFGVLNQNQTAGNAALEDIPNSVYARQRQNALDLYRDEANFKRQRALAEYGYGQQEHMAGLDALGDVGSFIGSSFGGDGNSPMDLVAYRKKLLEELGPMPTPEPINYYNPLRPRGAY